MKKNLLLLLGLLLGLTAKAQEPAITATGTVGEERTISVGLNAVGTVKLDWGNGTLVEKTTTQAYDGWQPLKHTTAGMGLQNLPEHLREMESLKFMETALYIWRLMENSIQTRLTYRMR